MDAFFADQRRKRDIALAVLLLSSLAFGIADLFLYRSEAWTSASWFLSTIVGVVAIYSWCRYDSHVQGFVLDGGLRLTIWLLALIGVPIYLVRTRGWARAARLGFGLPAFALSAGLYYAGWYGALWVAGRFGYFQR